MPRLAHSMMMVGLRPLSTLVLYSSEGLSCVTTASSGFVSCASQAGQVREAMSEPDKPGLFEQGTQNMWL